MKNHKAISLILLLFIGYQLIGQTIAVDSLKSVLSTSDTNTDRVHALMALSDETKNLNASESVRYGKDALELARTLNDEELIAQALYQLGVTYGFTGEHKKIKSHTIEALRLTQDEGLRSKLYNSLGVYYLNAGNVDSARHYFSSYYDVANTSNLADERANAQKQMGLLNAILGDYVRADSFWHITLDHHVATKNAKKIPSLAYNLSLLSLRMDDYERAQEYAILGLDWVRQEPDHGSELSLVYIMSKVADYQGDSTRFLSYLKRADQIIEDYGFKSGSATDVMFDLAWYYLHINDLGLAEKAAKKLIDIGHEAGRTLNVGQGKIILAKIYQGQNLKEASIRNVREALHESTKTADIAVGSDILEIASTILLDYDMLQDAEQVIDVLNENAKEVDNQKIWQEANFLKYRLHKKRGEWESALAHYESYKMYSDSFLIQSNTDQLMSIRTEYETEIKEEENKNLKSTNALISDRNTKLLWSAIGLLSLVLALTFLYNQIRIAKNEINRQNDKLSELNKTKDRLFAIISHDLRSEISAFKSLNSIFGYHLKKGNTERLDALVQEVDKSATNVNNLMDNLLEWSSSQLDGISVYPQSLNVKKEAIDVLKIFEQFAESKGIQLQDKIDQDMFIMCDEHSFQLILRNLLSNALKFTPKGGKVSVSTRADNRFVSITVSDTGVGIASHKIDQVFNLDRTSSQKGTSGERGTGLGLALVKEFIERNGGQISITSELNIGTSVTVLLPMAA